MLQGSLGAVFASSRNATLGHAQDHLPRQVFLSIVFQEPGVAEAEFQADVRTSLRKFYHMASGQMDIGLMPEKPADADLLSDLPDPEQMGAWMSDADLDFYVNEFSRNGFRGPLNYYRNLNLTWELTEGAPTEIQQPALFVAGDRRGHRHGRTSAGEHAEVRNRLKG